MRKTKDEAPQKQKHTTTTTIAPSQHHEAKSGEKIERKTYSITNAIIFEGSTKTKTITQQLISAVKFHEIHQ